MRQPQQACRGARQQDHDGDDEHLHAITAPAVWLDGTSLSSDDDPRVRARLRPPWLKSFGRGTCRREEKRSEIVNGCRGGRKGGNALWARESTGGVRAYRRS
jgi:hypothetical protein